MRAGEKNKEKRMLCKNLISVSLLFLLKLWQILKILLLVFKDLVLAKSTFSSIRQYDKDWMSLIKHRL